jgi:hypothetical protein
MFFLGDAPGFGDSDDLVRAGAFFFEGVGDSGDDPSSGFDRFGTFGLGTLVDSLEGREGDLGDTSVEVFLVVFAFFVADFFFIGALSFSVPSATSVAGFFFFLTTSDGDADCFFLGGISTKNYGNSSKVVKTPTNTFYRSACVEEDGKGMCWSAKNGVFRERRAYGY